MSSSSDMRDSAGVAERFRCRRHEVGAGVVRISVAGELDSAGTASLVEVLESAERDGSTTVIDLDELTFIDIAGARTLRAAASQAREHGRRLIAVNGSPEVEKWLRMMGLDRHFKLVKHAE